MTRINAFNHNGYEVQILKPVPIGWVNALHIKVWDTGEEATKAMEFFFGDDKINEYRTYEALMENPVKEEA